jgi:hypothetical protein
LRDLERQGVHFRAVLGRERRCFLVKPLEFLATNGAEALLKGVTDRAHAPARRN